MTPPSVADTVEIIPLTGGAESRPATDSALVRVDLGGLSHPGHVRPNNEDHFLIGRFGRYLEAVRTNLPAGAVPPRAEECGYGMAVADGMGGAAAGEDASRLALAALVDLVLRTPDWILRLDDEPLPGEFVRRAADRYERVNQALAAGAAADPARRGYGTTLTLACSLGRELFVTHLGDSRAYLFRGGGLRRLTRDHTLAAELADRRAVDRTRVAAHRLRHVLTRCLGDHDRPVEPDVTRVELADGDGLLLCTDGLTDMVPDEAIGEMLASGGSAQEVCERLVDAALAAGGRDNVTAVVARYQFP